MKRTHLISLLGLVVVVVIVAWSLQTPSRTEQKRNDKAATQAISGKWTVVSEGVVDNLRDFEFLDENHGWGVTKHSLWKTADGGRTWKEIRKAPSVKVLENYEPLEIMEQIQFLSESDGWIVEGNYLVHTTDGGGSWQKHEVQNVIVRSVRFLDQDNGWFVGQVLRLPSRKGEIEGWNPVIYGTKNGGTNWRRLYMGPDERYPLWGIWPVSAKDIWAVGSSLLHSDDAGATWEKVYIKDRLGVSGMPYAIRFLDSNVGWIKTNEPGGYFVTHDGGKTWEPRSVSIVPGGFADIAYTSPSEAYGVARAVYHSNDSGRTWTKMFEGDYLRIEYLSSARCLFAAGSSIAKYRFP